MDVIFYYSMSILIHFAICIGWVHTVRFHCLDGAIFILCVLYAALSV